MNFRQIRRYLWPYFLAVLTFCIVRYSIAHPEWVNGNYSRGIYPALAGIFSTISGLFPFSLWDLFWAFLIGIVILGMFLVVLKRVRLIHGIHYLLSTAALIYTIFYLVWGLNYFRPPIAKRNHWRVGEMNEDLFYSTLDTIISRTNQNRVKIDPSAYPEIDRMVEESYRNNKTKLGIDYPNGSRTPKTMIFSKLFAKSGVSGYFGPFFNEVHLNYYLLPMEYPFVLAHEKAHQFGITNEAEANLAAFVVCSTSSDERLRYSGYLNALLYFVSDASKRSDAKSHIRKIDKKVVEDIRFQRSHWQGLENKTLGDVQTAANNAYLKTNHIEEGVKNYNQMVGLILSWYNQPEN